MKNTKSEKSESELETTNKQNLICSPVEGTPYTIVDVTEDGKRYVMVGNYLVKDHDDNATVEDLENWCKEITWAKITQIMHIFTESRINKIS